MPILLESGQLQRASKNCGLTPEILRERTAELEHHHWFSGRNRNEAMDLSMTISTTQADGSTELCSWALNQLIETYALDRSDRAVYVSKKLGIPAKLFAVSPFPERIPFAISGRDWDWQVYPVNDSGKPVPDDAVRNLQLCLNEGVIFDGVGVAVPESTEFTPFGEIAKDEVRKAGRSARGAASLTLELVSDVMQDIRRTTMTVYKYADNWRRNQMDSGVVQAWRTWRDPVLLGMYKGTPKGNIYLVEIARWD
ncbi:hypothetical protein ACFL0Q_02015 [Thermodesulfobacteriota bacterium]